jgi:hypothetical protein
MFSAFERKGKNKVNCGKHLRQAKGLMALLN